MRRKLKNLAYKSFLYVNIGFAFFLVISSFSPLINPQKAWSFAFLGLCYPSLLIINLLFIFFWIFRKMKRMILISLISIIIGWCNVTNVFHFPGKKRRFEVSENNFKILSYNVRVFNKYKWIKTGKAEQTIFDFITENNADIICIQEFSTNKTKELSATFDDSVQIHFHPTSPKTTLHYGLATFTTFPIVNRGNVFLEESANGCIFSDIVVDTDTLRIYNAHLQSVHLNKKDYQLIDSLQLKYSDDNIQGMKDISYKMKEAYIKRAEQAETISIHISTSPYPIILCGDFNDTPISYTYRKMKADLNDAYRKSGSGSSNTYVGRLPFFRIDFIFYDKMYKSYNYKRHRIASSDHYPISCDFIKNE